MIYGSGDLELSGRIDALEATIDSLTALVVQADSVYALLSKLDTIIIGGDTLYDISGRGNNAYSIGTYVPSPGTGRNHGIK
jgi:hypothetical protein